jgi:LDH2 family malate/lactate/ureidoglycolate dehydrogenase
MSSYPATENERRVPADDLRPFVTRVFVHCGMGASDAVLLADTLVAADLRGIHSHGVLRVPDYVDKLTAGGVDPKGRPRIVRDSGAALVVDGGNSMGQVGATFAMNLAIERAQSTGVAVATVGGSNHCGALFYYAMLALPAGMIGIAATNALPTMAPWGGIAKIVGINPLAVAIPAGNADPIVLDAAFSYSSHGKIRVYQQKGLDIPATWAFDRQGRPTTSAAEALEGLLQPIGEYKGVGLAVVMGVLSSLLSGAAYGTELGNMVDGPLAGRDGHFLMALRIDAFEDPEHFRHRVDSIVRQIETSPATPGVDRLFAPGGREAQTARSYGREGIPLNSATLTGLQAVADRFAIDSPVLR